MESIGKHMVISWQGLISIIIMSICISGCSPSYVMRAAYEQVSILASREPIHDVLSDPKNSDEIKEKLLIIQQAKAFSEEIGLKKNGAFSSYVALDREQLSWIVMASKKTSFEVKTWWFPFVGTVPYKGFFEKDDAFELAESLEQDEGLETWVRPTDAYSTLGWFDDPVLSPLLKRSIPDLVNTVIHEQFHATYWFKNQVPFNETAANIVGLAGAIDFFQQAPEQIKQTYLPMAQQNLENARRFSAIINEFHDELKKVYDDSTLSEEQKLSYRQEAFERLIGPLRAKNPEMKSFQKLNNAEIAQSKTYFTDFDVLDSLYKKTGSASLLIKKFSEVFDNFNNSNENSPLDDKIFQ